MRDFEYVGVCRSEEVEARLLQVLAPSNVDLLVVLVLSDRFHQPFLYEEMYPLFMKLGFVENASSTLRPTSYAQGIVDRLSILRKVTACISQECFSLVEQLIPFMQMSELPLLLVQDSEQIRSCTKKRFIELEETL